MFRFLLWADFYHPWKMNFSRKTEVSPSFSEFLNSRKAKRAFNDRQAGGRADGHTDTDTQTG